MRSALALGAIVAIAIVALAVVNPPNRPPERSTEPATTQTPVAAASSAAPTEAPLREVVPGLRTRAAGVIPRDFRYARVTAGGVSRLYLVDLSASREPVEVAQVDVPGSSSGAFVDLLVRDSTTPDGSLVVLAAPGRLYALRAVTGDATLIVEAQGVSGPVVSVDGRSLAFQRASAQGDINGVWVTLDGGPPRLLVGEDPGFVGSPPWPFFWTSARTLGVQATAGEGSSAVALVDAGGSAISFDPSSFRFAGAALQLAHPANGVDASRGERDLLFWSSRGPFGGISILWTYDARTAQTRELYRPADFGVSRASWHPSGDRLATVEQGLGFGLRSIWVRQADGTARRELETAEEIRDVWWSRDGTVLYALISTGSSTLRVDDVDNRRTMALVCAQGAGRACPAPTPTPTPRPSPQLAPGPIPWRIIGGVEACGTVRSYTPGTSTTDGSLAIGSRTFRVVPGFSHGATGFTPAPGTDMCVFGGLGDPPGTNSGAWPVPRYVCGYVLDFRPADRLTMLESRDNGLVTLQVSATAALGADVSRTHLRCFDISVDATTGDAQIVRRTNASGEEIRCGVVRRYAPPSPTAAGSITIGSQAYAIRQGVAYSGDPAGQRSDPMSVGNAFCVNGIVEDDGYLSAYGPARSVATGSSECGSVLAYRPPTASTPGEIRLHLTASGRAIPPGFDVGNDPLGYRCFAYAFDGQGDMIVARRIDRLPMVVTSSPWPTRAP